MIWSTKVWLAAIGRDFLTRFFGMTFWINGFDMIVSVSK